MIYPILGYFGKPPYQCWQPDNPIVMILQVVTHQQGSSLYQGTPRSRRCGSGRGPSVWWRSSAGRCTNRIQIWYVICMFNSCIYLFIYLSTNVSIYLFINLLNYLFIYLFVFYLSIYWLIYLSIDLSYYSSMFH